MFYRQCSLEKKTPEGTLNQVSWIPEEFAKKGKFIKLKEGEEWQDGWKVINVGGRKEEKEVRERSRDHKNQREASDI